MSNLALTASFVIPDANRILLFQTEQGWVLPQLPVSSYDIDLHLIHDELYAQYRARLSLLRFLSRTVNREAETAQAWLLMENHTGDWQIPENSRWFGAEELSDLALANEYERSILMTVLASFQEAEPALRPMFMKPNWLSEMQLWVQTTLEQHAFTLIRPPQQFKQFILTAIIRAETEQGVFYAKVVNPKYPLFCDEAHTMQALSAMFPDTIPTPLAIHPDNGLAIFPDFGKSLWQDEPEQAQYEKIVEIFAAMQQKTATQHEKLLAAGCINRSLDIVSKSIDSIVADGEILAQVPDTLHEQWLGCGDKLKELCEQLATYNLPHTLVHGDFHGGNIAIDGERVTIFDWTDACIAHPFFDVTTMIEFKEDYADILREAYLKCWLDYEPMERLLEAYNIAYVLSAVHQLISYDSIKKHSDDAYRSYFNWSIPHFVGVVIKKLAALEKSV